MQGKAESRFSIKKSVKFKNNESRDDSGLQTSLSESMNSEDDNRRLAATPELMKNSSAPQPRKSFLLRMNCIKDNKVEEKKEKPDSELPYHELLNLSLEKKQSKVKDSEYFKKLT